MHLSVHTRVLVYFHMYTHMHDYSFVYPHLRCHACACVCIWLFTGSRSSCVACAGVNVFMSVYSDDNYASVCICMWLCEQENASKYCFKSMHECVLQCLRDCLCVCTSVETPTPASVDDATCLSMGMCADVQTCMCLCGFLHACLHVRINVWGCLRVCLGLVSL